VTVRCIDQTLGYSACARLRGSPPAFPYLFFTSIRIQHNVYYPTLSECHDLCATSKLAAWLGHFHKILYFPVEDAYIFGTIGLFSFALITDKLLERKEKTPHNPWLNAFLSLHIHSCKVQIKYMQRRRDANRVAS